MAKVSRIKSQAKENRIPQNRDEVVAMIAEIGSHQRDRQRLKADMDDKITAIREEYDKLLAPHSAEIEALTEGVHTWCEANRTALTQGNKVKFANLMTGEIKWRMRPPKVAIKNNELVLEQLKLRKMVEAIRTKEEINKEAILADPARYQDIKGITITQGEDFVILPFETELEEVA
jgi:phage host-nuclease inhibitor protein Gam